MFLSDDSQVYRTKEIRLLNPIRKRLTSPNPRDPPYRATKRATSVFYALPPLVEQRVISGFRKPPYYGALSCARNGFGRRTILNILQKNLLMTPTYPGKWITTFG